MSARLQFGTMRRYDLTPRQREVLALIAAGKTNAEIAEDLDISLDGAKYHVREILGKLGVESREEAAAAWREFRSPLARLGGWWSSLATLLARPLLLAGVSVLAGGLALALVLLIVSRDSDNPTPAAGVTPAPAPTVTPSPSPSPSPSATSAAVSRPACTAANVTFGLDLVPRGDDVIVRLNATGAGECLLVTTAELDIMRPPIDPTPPLPPYANMHRDFHLALEFPFSGVVAEWRWSNWCGPNGQIHLWQAHGAAPGLLFAQRPVDLFPACTDSGAPTTLRLDQATTGFDGDLLPVASRAGDFPGWACEFAQRSVTLVAQGKLGRLVNGAMVTSYLCGPGGNVVGFEYSDLCRGHQEGEYLNGYPLTLHGSEGGPVSPDALIARLQPLLAPLAGGTAPRLAAVGCADPGSCQSFILAWSTGPQPGVAYPGAAYLVFQLVPGREPSVIGAGLSGDNADTILGGGVTQTMLGATRFFPWPRPG